MPQQLASMPQIAFHDNKERSFEQWASGTASEEPILCTVNTAHAAMSLVAAGVGVSVLSQDCIQEFPGVQFVPVRNWHQALYLCILYDKWLEPPIWVFVERVIKILRDLYTKH
jgi:DNA-binding transcriptional LysR family regulator